MLVMLHYLLFKESVSFQSTASKMVIGIVAGICTVVALFIVFGAVYCYCCTSCCASKPTKVQPGLEEPVMVEIPDREDRGNA